MWIDIFLDDHFDLLPTLMKQSDNHSATSHCPPPVFVLGGESSTSQPPEDDICNILSSVISPKGVPSSIIPYLKFDNTLVASDDVLVADSYNSDEPDLNIYTKESTSGNADLAKS